MVTGLAAFRSNQPVGPMDQRIVAAFYKELNQLHSLVNAQNHYVFRDSSVLFIYDADSIQHDLEGMLSSI